MNYKHYYTAILRKRSGIRKDNIIYHGSFLNCSKNDLYLGYSIDGEYIIVESKEL